MIERLIDAAVDRSRTIISILLFIFIAGVTTYIEIPKESSPDVKIPVIVVSLHHEGISPEDAERLLLRPIEQKLQAIEGVKEMKGTARENGGSVILQFRAGFDSDKALVDVRDKVDEAKSDLPAETDDPTVKEVSFSQFPVIVVNLSGDIPLRALYKKAEDLADLIEGEVSSVLEVTISGDREEAVEIIIDPVKIEEYGINFQQVIRLFKNNNALISAGVLDTGDGRFPVKIPGVFANVVDILNAPIITQGDTVVKFSDIATIRTTYKDPLGFARSDGKQAVALEVKKRTGENIIATIDQVTEVVERERKDFPANLKVTYTQDQSVRIEEFLGDLENNVIAAVLLVMLVMVVTLGWRSALLVGVAVPGSFLMGIMVLAVQGLTLNIVVLFSLILSVGMLVDGAIIIAEYADRKMIDGYTPRQAYTEAAYRMAWPVITSIITIIAAFLPLLFWPGIVGEFMKFLPLTLIATLSASILMALIFLPSLGSVFGRISPHLTPEKIHQIHLTEEGNLAHLKGTTGQYIKILNWGLEHPLKIVFGVFGMLVGVIFLQNIFGHGLEFFPRIEPEIATMEVRARGNLSVWERDDIVREVENRILDMTEFKSIYSNTDLKDRTKKMGDELAEDTVGVITLEFGEWQSRRKARAILDEVIQRTKDIPGIFVEVAEEREGPPVGKAIFIQISSRQNELLIPALEKIRAYVDRVDGLKGVDDTRPIPGMEWSVTVNRAQAAKFGADISQIGTFVRMVSNGFKIDEFRPDYSRDEVDILIRFPEKYRNFDQLRNMKIQTLQGAVPVSTFTTQGMRNKIDVIKRVDGQRVYNITADVQAGVNANAKREEIQEWISKNHNDDRVKVSFKGEDEEQEETKEFLGRAFWITIFLIALILVTQFNSFFSMGLVLSAVVLSSIGVLIGLMVMGQPFGIVMSGIGVIALGGIIVSNNIIFIDTFDQLVAEYKKVALPQNPKRYRELMKEIILRTGAQRLRPVLLTQITTVLGLVPMVLRINFDFFNRFITYDAPSSQWWVQLATAIVFGVTFATVLTLILTPCALMMRENYRARKRGPIY